MDAARSLSTKGRSFEVRRLLLGMYLLHSFVPGPQPVLTSLPCLLRACACRVEVVWEVESSVAILECL